MAVRNPGTAVRVSSLSIPPFFVLYLTITLNSYELVVPLSLDH